MKIVLQINHPQHLQEICKFPLIPIFILRNLTRNFLKYCGNAVSSTQEMKKGFIGWPLAFENFDGFSRILTNSLDIAAFDSKPK